MKPVGIIILNWNGAALLRRYLPSVVAANSNDIADVVWPTTAAPTSR